MSSLAQPTLSQAENRLRALNALMLALWATAEARPMLDLLAQHLDTHLPIEALLVVRHQPHTHTLVHVLERGLHDPCGEGFFRPLSEDPLAERILRERALVCLTDAAQADHSSDSPLLRWSGEEFQSLYGWPLGEFGLIQLFQRTAAPLAPADLDFAQTSITAAGLALRHLARLEALQLAHLDMSLGQDAILEGWARALDLRSKETEGHTMRVTDLTLRLARAMGLPDAELKWLRVGALLHDIGKAGLPESLLLKSGLLTDDEWQIMCRHPAIAYELLYPIQALRAAVDIPYCHHERWDGTGYPRGLKGEQIPMAARLFAVADVWDALQSDRPYRPGQVEKQVRQYIRSNSGKHFDPAVVDVFLQVSQVA